MKKNIIISGLLVLLGLSSCADFLDLDPISVASVSKFYKNQTDVETAVNASYAALQSDNLYRANYITMMEVRSDNVTDNNPGGAAGIYYNIDQFNAKPDNSVIRDVWKASYNEIYRVNNVIASIDVVSNATLRLQYEAEARFLRALTYFNIVRFWGAAPLLLTPVSPSDTYKYGRDSETEIYKVIVEDLLFAQQLPKKYSDKKDLGKATSGAAKTLLAKVYLTQNQYPDAVNVLEDLIANYKDVYGLQLKVADVFDITKKMNNEIIFAVRYSKTVAGEGNSFHDAYKKFDIDPQLISAYEVDKDERRTLIADRIDINKTLVVKKFAEMPDAVTGAVGFDFPVLRYADVLLMYAEALNETGYSNDENGAAFTALNAVRNRAKATAYTNLVLTDQASFKDAVLQERRLEFPLENHRWFDLLRTGTAISVMGKVNQTITQNDLLYPIPKTEVDIINDPNRFPQNPGYN